MIVVDASAVLEVLLNTPNAPAVEKYLYAQHQTAHAPHLIDLEIMQVLRRHAATRLTGPARARQAVQDYQDMPITRYAHGALLPRIWDLRHNLTAYDAAYIALAEALEAPLLTSDRTLRSMSGHHAKILVV